MDESKRAAQGVEGQDVTGMVLSIFDKVREIKRVKPDIARKIDRCEKEIRDLMVEIRKQIDLLDKKDKELVAALVINGIHRTADEVLID